MGDLRRSKSVGTITIVTDAIKVTKGHEAFKRLSRDYTKAWNTIPSKLSGTTNRLDFNINVEGWINLYRDIQTLYTGKMPNRFKSDDMWCDFVRQYKPEGIGKPATGYGGPSTNDYAVQKVKDAGGYNKLVGDFVNFLIIRTTKRVENLKR